MIIDSSNYATGNRALASVLLLYFHLLREGGITNDQTVFLDPAMFNGFDYLRQVSRADSLSAKHHQHPADSRRLQIIYKNQPIT